MSHYNYERAGNRDTDSDSNSSMITIQMHLTQYSFMTLEFRTVLFRPSCLFMKEKPLGIKIMPVVFCDADLLTAPFN